MAHQGNPEVVNEKVNHNTAVPGHTSNDLAVENKETLANHQYVSSTSSNEDISPDAQEGVKDVEALTLTWSRTHLILAYLL